MHQHHNHRLVSCRALTATAVQELLKLRDYIASDVVSRGSDLRWKFYRERDRVSNQLELCTQVA
eukprot:COSAG01_NODE_8149_length_2902_cov_7.029254_4_plen_64_part_00